MMDTLCLQWIIISKNLRITHFFEKNVLANFYFTSLTPNHDYTQIIFIVVVYY